MLIARVPKDAELTGVERARAERYTRFQAAGSGYSRIQRTRPQTLSYALTDSPVGQLAWIAEKFTEWTDPATPVDRDQMLTDITLYWLTGTAGSSAQLYLEAAQDRNRSRTEPSTVPTGVAVFPH